jgi:hypothetical protein
MSKNSLPKPDLNQLQQEVLVFPPEAALPCNLPDHWLFMISRDLEAVLDYPDPDNGSDSAAAPMAIIIRILNGKNPGKEINIPLETLYQYMSDLQIEIGLEIVSRKTSNMVSPATIATIFTDREVMVNQHLGNVH